MDESLMRQVFEELFQSLEALETQNAALLALLKAKKVATERTLAPHLEEASKASSVRWMAARARLNRLLEAALRPTQQEAAKPAETKTGAKRATGEGKREEKGKLHETRSDTRERRNDKVEGAGGDDAEARVAVMRNPGAGQDGNVEKDGSLQEDPARPEEAKASSGGKEERRKRESEEDASAQKDATQKNDASPPEKEVRKSASA